jgi:hypothetical protein
MTKRIQLPDFKLLDGVVSTRILDATIQASKALDKLGVRHALIGGLAVGCYGYPRATKDVDFLIGDEGFEEHGGGIVTFKDGMPIFVNGVVVDVLADETVEDQVEEPIESEGIPIVDPEALVYLKLKAWRRRDQEDVVQLLKKGLNDRPIREYLQDVAPDLVEKFDELVDRADDAE